MNDHFTRKLALTQRKTISPPVEHFFEVFSTPSATSSSLGLLSPSPSPPAWSVIPASEKTSFVNSSELAKSPGSSSKPSGGLICSMGFIYIGTKNCVGGITIERTRPDLDPRVVGSSTHFRNTHEYIHQPEKACACRPAVNRHIFPISAKYSLQSYSCGLLLSR